MKNRSKVVLSYTIVIAVLFALSFIPDLAHMIRLATHDNFNDTFTEVEITKFLNVLRIVLLFIVVYSARLILIKVWKK
jgi:hypothetical protein